MVFAFPFPRPRQTRPSSPLRSSLGSARSFVRDVELMDAGNTRGNGRPSARSRDASNGAVAAIDAAAALIKLCMRRIRTLSEHPSAGRRLIRTADNCVSLVNPFSPNSPYLAKIRLEISILCTVASYSFIIGRAPEGSRPHLDDPFLVAVVTRVGLRCDSLCCHRRVYTFQLPVL